jgi:hypothetical protein
VPHHDFDDSATMAIGVCQVLFNPSRGLRGGDLQPRPAMDPSAVESRLRCPGAANWGANSPTIINQAIGRFRVPNPSTGHSWSHAEMLSSVVSLVSSQSWYGATPRESAIRPAPVVAPDPQQAGCSVGTSASELWRRIALSSAAASRP